MTRMGQKTRVSERMDLDLGFKERDVVYTNVIGMRNTLQSGMTLGVLSPPKGLLMGKLKSFQSLNKFCRTWNRQSSNM